MSSAVSPSAPIDRVRGVEDFIEPFEIIESKEVGGNGIGDLSHFSELCWVPSSDDSFETATSNGVGGNGITDLSSFVKLFWTLTSFR